MWGNDVTPAARSQIGHMSSDVIASQFAELKDLIVNKDDARLATLLASGTNANSSDVAGRTLLMAAAELGNANAVKLLLSHGAKVNARDRLSYHDQGGSTALHRAARYQHHEIVRLLITSKADLNVCDKNGQTALHWAAENGDLPMTQLLLDAGANPDRSCRTSTSLSTAVVLGHIDIVRLLLSKGAQLSHPANARTPVLQYAVHIRKPDLCRLLIEAGADVNATDYEGRTAWDKVKNGLTKMPDRLPGLSAEQIEDVRRTIDASNIIRSILRNAGAEGSTN